MWLNLTPVWDWSLEKMTDEDLYHPAYYTVSNKIEIWTKFEGMKEKQVESVCLYLSYLEHEKLNIVWKEFGVIVVFVPT